MASPADQAPPGMKWESYLAKDSYSNERNRRGDHSPLLRRRLVPDSDYNPANRANVSQTTQPNKPVVIDDSTWQESSKPSALGRTWRWVKENKYTIVGFLVLAGLTAGLIAGGHKAKNTKMMLGAIAPGTMLALTGVAITFVFCARARRQREYELID